MMEMLLLINLDMKLNYCGQDKNNHMRVSRGGEAQNNFCMVIMSRFDLGKYLFHFK